MGRRRRKVITLPKKKLPKIFSCPTCGENSINIQIIREKNIAEVKCSKCGIKVNLSININDQPIDAYCKFTDMVYLGDLVHQ